MVGLPRRALALIAAVVSAPAEASSVVADLFRDGGVERSATWQRFHDAIASNQAACETVCVCNVEGAQLVSSIHGEATCLLEALVRNCTLLDTSADFLRSDQWPDCPSGRLHDCFLEPLASCDAPALARAARTRITATQYYGLLGERFPDAALAARFGVRGRLRAFAEVVGYVMRPRPRVSAAVDRVAAALGLADDPRDAVTAHSRQTDKRETYHGGAGGDGPATALLARHQAWTLGLGAIHFMTDAPEHVAAIRGDLARESRGPSVRLAVLDAGRSEDWVSEFLGECIVAAQGAALVAPLTSNVARVIAELMALVAFPPLVDDLYHEAWVPGAEHLVAPGRPHVTAAAAWRLG